MCIDFFYYKVHKCIIKLVSEQPFALCQAAVHVRLRWIPGAQLPRVERVSSCADSPNIKE